MINALSLIWCVIVFSSLRTACADDLLIEEFRENLYDPWTKTGTAFDDGPVSGNTLTRLEITNAGDWPVASSEVIDDRPIGTLTSPKFRIERNFIAFRIAGGDYEYDTCANLIIDGTIVRSATGWRSDRLVPVSWDVSQFKGREAQFQLVDKASGDWGHVNACGIVQTDNPERRPIETGLLYREAYRPQFHFTARQWVMNRLNPGMQQEGWINDLNGLKRSGC